MPDLKLAVEVCHARNLLARDADGTSSPFVVVEFDGQRLKTKTKDKDLNPAWNEKIEFKVRSKDVLDDNSIDVGVYTAASKNGQQRSLGSIKIPCSQVKSLGTEAANMVIPYSLERRNLFKSAFSRGRGELYLKLYHYEAAAAAEVPVVKKEEAAKVKKAEEEKAGAGMGDVKKTETKPSEAAVKAVTIAAEEVGTSFDVKTTEPKLAPPKVVHDLVVPMEYVFVKVVKARGLAAKDVTGSSDPYVEVKVGGSNAVTETRKQTLNPEWNRVFAFESSKSQGTNHNNNNNPVEIRVWDKDTLKTDDFLGYVGIDALEIPSRRPPDSPLAPQWYKLQQPPPPHRHGSGAGAGADAAAPRVTGEIMLAVWYGTQSDEAFHDAWQSDTAGISLNKSKVYVSPRLWYLRVSLLEAQDLLLPPSSANLDVLATVVLDGPHQQIHSRTAVRRNHGSSSSSASMKFGGGEILLVASEPFVDKLTIKISSKVSKDKDELIGAVSFPLYNVPKRYDRKPVEPRWHELLKSEKKAAEEAEKDSKDGAAPPKLTIVSSGRIYLSLSLEGGYHVLDETTQYTSDVQPADRRLWKPAMGVLELGILSATGLLPTKTRDGKGTADAYCIAKYGNKWIRTRTVVGSLAPQWHEQYTWEVYDPCTVLTVGVFDNHLAGGNNEKHDDHSSTKDATIGKLRIRLSTLNSDRTYTHSYPLISVEKSGLKKKGELEIAVRFSCTSQFHLLKAYGQPLLPKLHYAEPLGLQQTRALRRTATRIQMHYLQRAEPPLPAEAVRYMLDADEGTFSYRRTKATWNRMLAVIAGPRRLARWIEEICAWKNPMSTGLVIALYMTLVCFPEQILPTLFLYVCLVGTWHWRFRPTHPPHMDVRLSQVTQTSDEELDEELDTVPSSRPPEVIRARYERLRGVAGRVQSEMADLVAQMERFQALLSWRDPRATFIFLLLSFVIAVFLYVVPLRVVAVLVGIYAFRPPRFRHRHPTVPLCFFKRLPALSDSVI